MQVKQPIRDLGDGSLVVQFTRHMESARGFLVETICQPEPGAVQGLWLLRMQLDPAQSSATARAARAAALSMLEPEPEPENGATTSEPELGKDKMSCDMTAEEVRAVRAFGYTEATWDAGEHARAIPP